MAALNLALMMYIRSFCLTTYKSEPVAQVRVVRVVRNEVCRDTKHDQGGDGVKGMVCSEERAVGSVGADGRGAVVVCGGGRCCRCYVTATTEGHCRREIK